MNKRGFTIFELILAMAIVALISSALNPLIFNIYIRIPYFYTKENTMYRVQEDMLEDISRVEQGFIPLYSTLSPDGSFSEALSDDISFKNSAGTSSYVFSVDIADWHHTAGASTCNINPYDATRYRIASIYPLPSTFVPAGIDILNGYAYVAGKSTDTQKTGPDFYVFDLSSTTSPVLLANARLSGGGSGFTSMHALPDLIILSERQTRYPLIIIDTSNKSSPKISYQYEISTSNNLTGYGFGNTISYYDHRIFLGLTKSTSSEIYVFSFDPNTSAEPSLIGSYETDTQINAFAEKNSTLFVATPGEKQVRLLDISDPSRIIEKSYISPSGYAVQDGASLFIIGNTLYVGRTVGGFDNPNNHEFLEYDISDEYHPNLSYSQNIGSSLTGIVADHGKSFFYIGASSTRIGIYDLASSSPYEISQFKTADSTGYVDCEDDTIVFVSNRGGISLLTK